MEVLEDYSSIIGDHLKKKNDNSSEQMASIEYYMINLPESLTQSAEGSGGPSKFIKCLLDYDNIDIYENLLVKTIIDYKWQRYTRNFFAGQFILFLCFLTCYCADLFYSVFFNLKRNYSATILIKALCMFFLAI